MVAVCSHILYLLSSDTFLNHFIANLFFILEKKKNLFYLKRKEKQKIQLFATQSIIYRVVDLLIYGLLDTMMHPKIKQ